jgi:hypothetical protein
VFLLYSIWYRSEYDVVLVYSSWYRCESDVFIITVVGTSVRMMWFIIL